MRSSLVFIILGYLFAFVNLQELSGMEEPGNKLDYLMAFGEGHMFYRTDHWVDLTTKKADEFLVSLGIIDGESPLIVPPEGDLMKAGFPQGKNPSTEISNGILKASIYLPDKTIGYYRATRFDWSGIISSLEYHGHNYFGKWFDNYNPTAHYSIMGPVDAFDPLNYNDAKPGNSFVKIGVGSLTKPDDSLYNTRTTYPINDPGIWRIVKEDASIQFRHILNDKEYPYVYTKTIEFIEGKAQMLIYYNLKNTGVHPIETEVFNHNFFVFDDQVVDKGFELTFTKEITCDGKATGIGDIARIHENKLTFLKSLANGESVYCDSIKGANNNAPDYDIRIDSPGAGVRIRGNQPLSKLVFWSRANTICPEPYIKIKVEPGESFSWETSYEFYINHKTDK